MNQADREGGREVTKVLINAYYQKKNHERQVDTEGIVCGCDKSNSGGKVNLGSQFSTVHHGGEAKTQKLEATVHVVSLIRNKEQ